MRTLKTQTKNINPKGDVEGKTQKTVNLLNKKAYNPDKAEAYWLGQFDDAVFETFTFTDSQNSNVKSMDYDLEQRKLGRDLSGKIKEIADILDDETAFFLAISMILLGKYENQNNIVVGTI